VLWTRRPFGFEREGAKVRVVEAEAAAIREAANTILKGGTLASVATTGTQAGSARQLATPGALLRLAGYC